MDFLTLAFKGQDDADDAIQQDLLAAHMEALLAGEKDYYARLDALFPEEMRALQPLFELAEQIHVLLSHRATMRPAYREALKRDLLAAARQQQLKQSWDRWRWAAIGASAAAVIAAAAWRGGYYRLHK